MDFLVEWVKPFVITVAGSSVGVGIIKLIYEHWMTKSRRDEKARHLASQIVFQLEGYVIDLANGLAEQENFDNSDGHHGREMQGTPEFPELPKDDNYALLDNALLGRLYELPQERAIIGATVSAIYDIEDPETAEARYMEEAFGLAARVLDLIRDLRARYGLGARRLGPEDWDMSVYVRNTYDARRQKRLTYEKRLQESRLSMLEDIAAGRNREP